MSTVLLIEDDMSLRENLALFLQTEGFQVFESETGKFGLQLAHEKQPDLILCDLRLPDISGFEVARAIKEDSSLSGIPIIIISAVSGTEEIVRGLINAEDYITKPFNMAELKARVRSMLRLKEALDEIKSLNLSLEERVARRTEELTQANRLLAAEIRLRRESEEYSAELSRKLLEIREMERMQIAEELHDELGQQVVALKWTVQHVCDTQGIDAEVRADLTTRLDRINETVRVVSHQLSPAAFKNLGIRSAVEQMAQGLIKSGLSLELNLEALDDFFPEDWSIDLYRIIQEALTNILKHAAAGNMRMIARRNKSGLRLEISDNGIGMESIHREGLGLATMHQRAIRLGGRLAVATGKSGGTEVILEIPE